MIRRNAPASRASHRPRKIRLAKLRNRVLAAFRKLAHAVDERTAGMRTRNFYRSSATAWSRAL